MDRQMATLPVAYQLLSPACIADRPTAPGQIAATLGYLSGAVIRGALAARWLGGRVYDDWRSPAQAPHRETLDDAERKQFRELFLTGEVRYEPAWPRRAGAADTADTQIVPLTAWTAKENGGWAGEDRAGVYDVLTALLANDETRLAKLDDLEPAGDEFVAETGGDWRGVAAPRRLISRSAVNLVDPPLPSRGVAAEGQLFTMEALETGTTFVGTIAGPRELLDVLYPPRRQGPRQGVPGPIAMDAILAMGRGRTRGGGQARVDGIGDPVPAIWRNPRILEPLAIDFSTRAGLTRGQLAYLPVTLESDVILRDRFLLPCSSGSPRETLGRYRLSTPYPPQPPSSMTLKLAIQRTRWVGGWDMIREMPRAPELAVQAGSVWVYQVNRNELLHAIDWWLGMEQVGLGERRAQGYGRVRLFHPFHRAAEGEKW